MRVRASVRAILIAAILPWFLLVLAPMLVFFLLMTTIFRRAIRQVRAWVRVRGVRVRVAVAVSVSVSVRE